MDDYLGESNCMKMSMDDYQGLIECCEANQRLAPWIVLRALSAALPRCLHLRRVVCGFAALSAPAARCLRAAARVDVERRSDSLVRPLVNTPRH